MTPAEYQNWLPGAIEDYAREDVEQERLDPERARANMSAFLESAIPRGPRTEGHRMSIVEDAATAERVGFTWWAERELDTGPAAWIYDVYIDEPHRGKGFGRGLMEALEAQVREAGLTRMELHVWVDNDPATSLYRSFGFVPAGMEMFKQLD
ncbi:MAG: GNAT family N-acetyltransferase [Actinomycetota bacterium]|nr:GNAT family N-acetyltransferase [Actinomycetota bacterium]